MTPIALNAEQMLVLDTIPDPVVLYDLDGIVLYVNLAFTEMFGWRSNEVIGTHMDFVPEGQHSQLTGAVAVLLRANTFLTPDTKRRTKEGIVRDVQINTSLLADAQNRPIGTVVVMRDITERKRMEQAEREQRLMAEALNEIALTLNSTLDLSRVLDAILINVGKVVPHELSIVSIIEGEAVVIAGCRDYTFRQKDRELQGQRLVIDQTPTLRAMMASRAPLIISDFAAYPDMTNLPDLGWLNSYIGVPIELHGEVIGFISVQRVLPGFFDETHAARLQTFAQQAATAIHNARLYENAQQFAALNERHRIARDLHDAVSQTLFSANAMSETLLIQYRGAAPELHEGLMRLRELTQGALAEMRTLLFELRPEAIIRTSLNELLEHLVNPVVARKHIRANLDFNREVRLPPDIHLVFYRIAQEAMNNIVKHAQAAHLNILLHGDNERVRLTIQDDGVGFLPGERKDGRFGLNNMQERAAAAGAVLQIESTPGDGTTITLVWADPQSTQNNRNGAVYE